MRVLSGGLVFTDGELRRLDVGFDDYGRIVELGEELAGEALDCSGLVILPGMIDVHVHFRDFAEAYKEDWQSGGRAAVKGGVTMVLEMPNTDPPTLTPAAARRKRELAERSLVDFGLYGGLIEENIELIPLLAEEVQAFKLYLGQTTGGLTVTDPGALKEILQGVALTGKVLSVHAQRDGGSSRTTTASSEARDFERIIDLAVRYGFKLHLAHVSTGEGVRLIEQAKGDVDLTAETCPHYLFLTEEDLAREGARLKVNPPLARESDRGLLWEALQEGLIDMVASDHAPHTLEEKEQEFTLAPAGLPGVETTLPLLLDATNRGKLQLRRLVELFSTNPARRFGLERRGRIEVGYRADFTIVDLDLTRCVDEDELATKCGWSPFADYELRGWPVMTIVGGELVYHHPEIQVPPEWGHFEGGFLQR